jgi:hypothetical protein
MPEVFSANWPKLGMIKAALRRIGQKDFTMDK